MLSGVSLFALQSCVKTDDYATPDITCTDKFPATNHTLTDLSALGKTAPNANDVIQQDFIVEGYVSSNDESGNIYKTLYVQDAPSNPTQAIEVDIDAGSLYTKFPLGSKVRINAKGLIVQKTAGNVKLGSYDPSYPIGRINPNALPNYMARVCGNDGYPVVAQMIPVEFNSFTDAQKPENINKLVKINNVQFKDDALGTAAAPNNFTDSNPAPSSGITERGLVDKAGGSIVIRNSGYANFANTPMRPKYEGSGSITMILSLYSTSTWQGYIRDTNDLKLDGTRFTVDLAPPKGGTALAYLGAFTENFESYATTPANLEVYPKYVNDAAIGNRYWQLKSFGGNKYIQLGANSGSGQYETYFIVPVDFTAANSMSFKVNVGFWNGAALSVYTTTNYTPLGDISNATLADITSSFTVPQVPTTGYGASFSPAGTYNFPASLTGNGYVVFKYTGNGTGVTTTIQLDDIVVQ